ncbi:alkaline phosphatase PhoX [Roseivirga sp. BDSF3-8]|uniref:alkaline phosphatase PhoX n=1 Tax=Roseivirga sp. BDSF3-8 TaxID=3241598 RepID=UPI0035320568
MKKFYLLLCMLCCTAAPVFAQFYFPVEVEMPADFVPETVVMPPNPLKYQILFIGEVDKVQTTATYGNAPGEALAKQWHDFIGFTPDNDSEDLGWISVNHEMVVRNDSIGDGGGMTVFKVRRDPATDTLVIVEQTLSDGRNGKYFNVDFVNTVGETGMNCGGITSSYDGRIWTAEEWFRTSNDDISPLRDTSDWVISTDIPGNFAGKKIERYENFNYMVEIDPREAKAIRKQYNWGRQPFEGGTVMPDNQTVYLGADATPGLFTKFVADVPGDFRKGKLYVYKHDAEGEPWIEMKSDNLQETLKFAERALQAGATMFNRLEWVTNYNGKVYMTETGRDGIGTRFSRWAQGGGEGTRGVLDYHWVEPVVARHPWLADKTPDQVLDYVMAGNFNDYYGRVLEFDPATGVVRTYLEGGPFLEESPEIGNYPSKHMSNPDGLNVMVVNGQPYMVVCEDLNGTSNGRTPAGVSNRTCEMWLLDMKIENPTYEDLVRISVVPRGAEVTGACPTTDGKTLLVNSQHPSTSNPFPYNNSLTYAITGWDDAVTAIEELEELDLNAELFKAYPNPVSREIRFNVTTDVALYDMNGMRVRVVRNTSVMDVSDLQEGIYMLMTKEGEKARLVIQK